MSIDFGALFLAVAGQLFCVFFALLFVMFICSFFNGDSRKKSKRAKKCKPICVSDALKKQRIAARKPRKRNAVKP